MPINLTTKVLHYNDNNERYVSIDAISPPAGEGYLPADCGISNAEVGQLIKIEEVDGQGRPVAYSATSVFYTLTIHTIDDNGDYIPDIPIVITHSGSGDVYASGITSNQPLTFSLPTGFPYFIEANLSGGLPEGVISVDISPQEGIVVDTNIECTITFLTVTSIKTAAQIQSALNDGADLTDLVGEQITCTKGDDILTWDVVDYDHSNACVTLMLHDVFDNMVFEPPQALMWCENGLAAGAYTFKWDTTQVYFTLTTAIPAGGQLRATNNAFQTYASQSATTELETGTVSTTVIAGATDLGQTGTGLLNDSFRVSYGSNNFAESALYWWLNSNAPANTLRVPVTKFSRAYSYTQPGFLNGLDADFIETLDDTTWLCSTNNTYECSQSLGGYTSGTGQNYTVTSKFALAAEIEIFGFYNNATTDGGNTIYDLYNGATASDRIKYKGTNSQTWWLRSPYWSYSYNERLVHSSGSADYGNAKNSYGVAPVCKISATGTR